MRPTKEKGSKALATILVKLHFTVYIGRKILHQSLNFQRIVMSSPNQPTQIILSLSNNRTGCSNINITFSADIFGELLGGKGGT